ncbi:MAG: hypothetical protein CM1200mP1_10740 [Candidatus Neomarinimicrobiota bacterium]|nr:MAG: hypothetical protein CM1200mP1_10740 [Candidatus Neomarinimicrobiota bacterium]
METLYGTDITMNVSLFIKGKGTLKTNFGSLDLSFGDYAVIPRGVIWQLQIEESMEMLIIESEVLYRPQKNIETNLGQLLKHSPFSERDIKTPDLESAYPRAQLKYKFG